VFGVSVEIVLKLNWLAGVEKLKYFQILHSIGRWDEYGGMNMVQNTSSTESF